MTLRRAFWSSVALVVAMITTMLLTGCSNILDMAEGLLLRDEVVAEAPASPESEYMAEVKADTTLAAVAAARAVIEQRWGIKLSASDLSTLSSVMAALQDVLEARALDSEAEALRRLEDTLRALEPG